MTSFSIPQGVPRSSRLRRAPISKTLVWDWAQADARALGHRVDSRHLLGGMLAGADAMLIAAAAGLAHLLRHGWVEMPASIITTAALGLVLALNGLYFSGAYTTEVTARLSRQVERAARVLGGVFVLMILLAYLTKTSEIFSRAWAVAWFVIALGLLAGARGVAAAQIARWQMRGRLAATLAIVDLSGDGERLGRQLRQTDDEAHLLGVFKPDQLGDLFALSRLFRVDDVLVVVGPGSEADIAGMLRRLGTLPANVRLCPAMPPLSGAAVLNGDVVFGQLALTVHRKPLGGWNSVVKRTEDLVIGSIALLLLALPMLLIALCIRIGSPGPALFRQQRQGFNNNVFTVFKFRTMVHRDQPEPGVPQATRGDPRVTPIGRILRRTSLDELPQLLNVLRGEMSLVGPRPHAVAHNDLYGSLIDEYIGRHRVQPGITGWAQVNGLRGETDTLDKMQQRVEYDLAYISRWSVLFDLRILAMTLLTPFDRRAY